MLNRHSGLLLAEPGSSYQSQKWIEVLIDCPGREQKLYTYRLGPDLAVKSGDIVSVPFGSQQMGGIVIRIYDSPPGDLEPEKIKEVEDIIATGFFSPSYWQLFDTLAKYYYTQLFTAIKVGLPPGLLGRSQRRIRLNSKALPSGVHHFCSPTATQILKLLQSSPNKDYSAQYIQRQIRGATLPLQELLKRGWVESYLAPPKTARPKLQKVVTLVVDNLPPDLTKRQEEIIAVLRSFGGELEFNQLLVLARTTRKTVEALEGKGCVVMEEREVMRLEREGTYSQDMAKELTSYQAAAVKAIAQCERNAQVLLHGVTGSGKTEVYLQAIAPILAGGKSALVLVPEIGLTPQLTDRFRARFGEKVFVYHSALSPGERYDTWRAMLTGEPQIVIGTRSAVFAPLPKLGLIVLDEEHDSSFKQNEPQPTYHARTIAKWRSERENCPLILGSATPSLESWVAALGKNTQGTADSSYYLSLPDRIQSRPFPIVTIVDMRRELERGNRSIFSSELANALEQMHNLGQQGILFIPRRGHSTFVSCRSCGYVIECPHCDVSLSYHYGSEGNKGLLRCHYCNYEQVQPKDCPECGSAYLKYFGTGTQRVVKELKRQFPKLRSIRFDRDTTRTKGAHRMLLTSFAQREADLLVGTQMLTKGLDLPQLTLVGIVAADGLLHRSDYRASERAFQTLTQVAGRAGRGDDPGKVIIQTYSPDHPALQAVVHRDYESFMTAELASREELGYPPYGRLILLRLSGLDGQEVQQTAEVLKDSLQNLESSSWEILGPAPASVMRVARRYRWQILLKYFNRRWTQMDTDNKIEFEEATLPDLTQLRTFLPKSVSMTIDVDTLSID